LKRVNHYTVTVKIPENTPETSPVVEEVEVEGAVLTRLGVLIPPGHCGLARLALAYGIRQIYPTLKGDWLRGDDETVEAVLNWRLPETPCRLRLIGWNEDEVYPHMFIVRLEVAESLEEAFPAYALAKTLQALSAALMAEYGVRV